MPSFLFLNLTPSGVSRPSYGALPVRTIGLSIHLAKALFQGDHQHPIFLVVRRRDGQRATTASFVHTFLLMEHPFDLLTSSIRGVARAFIAQLPFIIIALVVFGAILLLARLLRALARRGLRRFDPAVAEMVSRLVYVVTVFLGVFVALWIAIPTLEFAEILTSLGVTGLILGFALKDIIENFVAGILILWRRPFHVGDQIRSGSLRRDRGGDQLPFNRAAHL